MKLKQILIIILLIFNFSKLTSAQNFNIDVFPNSKLYEKYFADALSPQFSISKHFESTQWFGNIGGELPIFNVGVSNLLLQSSINTTVFNTLIKTPGHIQVFTVDYRVDFTFDTEISKYLFARFIWGHVSAHFSDDGITQLKHFPISYVRDYIGLHFERKLPSLNGKFYIGSFINFHNEPALDKHTTFQVGGDEGIDIGNKILIYAAIDIKIKSEVNNGTTQSYQLGLRFPYGEKMYFRLAYTHRRGFEERGQLYNLKDNKNLLGLFIDF